MGVKKGSKNVGGRPTVMTPETIQILEEAFGWGCTDYEACVHANISTTALYRYCENNKAFAERKEQLKKTPEIAAKKLLAGKASESTGTARWLLERKQRDEFGASAKMEISGSVDVHHKLSQEGMDLIAAARSASGRGNGENDGQEG